MAKTNSDASNGTAFAKELDSRPYRGQSIETFLAHGVDGNAVRTQSGH